MKVKVKGLVFVGFAAAVFAQSAMAEGENKIVTSKQYVDNTFQTKANITTTSELDSATGAGLTALWTSETEYPSMAVLKSVKDTVTGMSFSGDNKYIDVATSNGATSVTLDTNNLASDAAAITSTASGDSTTPAAQDKLVKVSAVNAYAEAKANKAQTISSGDGGNSTDTAAYPTTKAVYDFVTGVAGNYQPKAPTTDTASLYVGHNGSGNVADWKKLQAQGGNALPGTTENYVTITESGGVYSIGLASANVGVDKADITNNTKKLMTGMGVKDYMDELVLTTTDGSITTNSTIDSKVPTVKNVYDFVTGAISTAGEGYQPVIDSGNAGNVMIGYNTRSGTEGNYTYSSNWRQLTVDSTYMNLDTTSGAAITLANIGHAGTDISGATAASAQSGTDKIASAYAVQAYVQSLLNGNNIPAPGSDCDSTAIGSDSSIACALVLANHGGTIGLKWIPMAQ